MLVDLARNDIGRVCKPGSVELTQSMVVERYSHVMHIVSQVEGNACRRQNRGRSHPGDLPGRDGQRRAEDQGY